MKLIVGLGNPGPSYSLTRHNIGFMALDSLAEPEDWSRKKSEKSFTQKINIQNTQVLLAKPQTKMNLSGEAVQKLLSYYKISVKDLLVVHDDIDLEFLRMKFQINRGSGGHNGVQNIHEALGRSDYYRLKLGVGRSLSQEKVPSYVLSPFEPEQLPHLEEFLVQSVRAIKHFVIYGGLSASDKFNQKPKKDL